MTLNDLECINWNRGCKARIKDLAVFFELPPREVCYKLRDLLEGSDQYTVNTRYLFNKKSPWHGVIETKHLLKGVLVFD